MKGLPFLGISKKDAPFLLSKKGFHPDGILLIVDKIDLLHLETRILKLKIISLLRIIYSACPGEGDLISQTDLSLIIWHCPLNSAFVLECEMLLALSVKLKAVDVTYITFLDWC